MITAEQKRMIVKALKPLATRVFCPTGEGGGVDPTCGNEGSGSGYVIKDSLKAKKKEIKEGMGLLRDQGLVLRNHPVVFDGTVEKGEEWGLDGMLISGLYHREVVLEDRRAGIRKVVGASIKLNKKTADSQTVVHEYGHHIDAVMGVARKGNDKADFSDEFAKWGIENTKFDSREDFADLFQALVYKGSSAAIGKGFNVSWKGDRTGFHKWFDDEVTKFIKEDNTK